MADPEPGTVESEETMVSPQHSKGDALERDGHSPFPIVGVGASAGGLDAFQGLLQALPAKTGMAYVLIQHLDPNHQSQLAEILGRATEMPVVEATNGLAIQPNHVYVIPPNSSLAVAQGVIVLSPRAEGEIPHLPIDYLFRSLAEEQRGRAIGVVLSGTGSDGTLGLCEIKAVGGITFAQDEASSGQPGMPKSARDSGCVDFVLPVAQIAARLRDFAAHPYLDSGRLARTIGESEAEGAFKKILGVVRAVKGVDFSLYRDTTIRRRIMRRMALHRQDRIVAYASKVEKDRDEVEALYHDLLINVTSFFRDAGLFETLKDKIYPALVKDRPPAAPIRAWVPGCSTGQEAYSIAMTLQEFFDDQPTRPPVQIFATDLTDQTTLDRARAGVYPETIEAEVTPDRLRRFFRREDHVYRVDKSLRDMCVFARQNVAADPPFSHLDLISCRNVLIYLASPLQRQVVPMFHYALNVPGYLVLGTAESVGENTDLFDLADRENRIYAKKAVAGRLPGRVAHHEYRAPLRGPSREAEPAGPTLADFQREADRVLLGRFSPPGVLVDDNMEVVQFRGRTSPYLEAPPGEPTTNLFKMAREGLLIVLQGALKEARQLNKPVRRERVRLCGDGPPREIALEIVPVRPYGTGNGCSLLLFHEGPHAGSAAEAPAGPKPLPEVPESPEVPQGVEAEAEVVRLQQELAATRDYMQTLAEQQDAANEELRSANEEILSSNEELQSTNEELETAKEELQSANEELSTVNEELQQRNREFHEVNSDLINLQTSTTIPVIMVGRDQRIRRFTMPARRVLNLLATDIGRPLADLSLPVSVPELTSMITEVIETMLPQEREVQDRQGRWYGVRVHPYRTIDNRIDGAVVVFLDVDAAKRVEAVLRDADRRKDVFLATLAHELRNPIAPIRNAVEILRLAPDDPAATAAARDVLHRQVAQLSNIIDDLIDVGRIIEGKVELRRRRVPLESVVGLAIETSRSLIEACGHRLSVSLPVKPLHLNADPARISQVFVNLLNNSAKYMERGGQIWLTAERVPMRRRTDAAIDEVRVSVRDMGVGIDSDLMPHIFDMFAQGEHAYEHSVGGLGVGLSLVRSLVSLHGGRIEVTSEGPGRGSEFTLFLPLATIGDPQSIDETPAPGAGASPAVSRRRILVVDDNVDQVQSLAMVLELQGHEVFVAHDGPRAIEVALSARPELALVDIGLPGMSGYDVARRLRERPELAKMVLVAQTGWGQEEDRDGPPRPASTSTS